MSRCKFVQPDVVRIALSDDEWIDVKKELNAGEERGVFAKLVKEMHFDQKATLDPEQVGLSKIVAYVVAWSFKDASEKSVPFSESALKNLGADTYAEISKAIDAHEETVTEARTTRKNAKGSTTDLLST